MLLLMLLLNSIKNLNLDQIPVSGLSLMYYKELELDILVYQPSSLFSYPMSFSLGLFAFPALNPSVPVVNEMSNRTVVRHSLCSIANGDLNWDEAKVTLFMKNNV